MARRLTLLLVVVLLATLVPNLAAAAPPDRIEPGLLDQLERGEVDRFVVEFVADADLDAAFGMRDRARRGRFVLDRLRETSSKSQAAAIAHAAAAGAEVTSYWLTNVLVVEGDADLARALATQPGVAQVRTEKRAQVVEPIKGTPRHPAAPITTAGLAPEWGVAKIGAPAAWDDGVLGGGIVVANVDTGVDHRHEALVGSYRGHLGSGTFSHDYNWWDPSGICGDTPCDNAEHGTHTMGTMVGGDGPGPFEPDIGVAPGAQWIAAKGCEDFFCTEESLLSSGQWILAPTDLDGLNPDPSKRPDIVNNSWGGGSGDDWYLGIVEAWRAAGIVPVFSAGNSGPGCGSGGSPGDYLASYSVGATDIDDEIAGFSSRGPSSFGKGMPDVAAPGVDVTSSVPGDGYSSFSGTSMAAPHTAGSLALMMSAAAELIGDVDGVTGLLSSTALDILDDQCGGDPTGDPNNVYGDGRIDAAQAVDVVKNGGILSGTVTDAEALVPVAGATVTATSHDSGRASRTTSAADGTYSLFLPDGAHDVVVTAFGYYPSTGDLATIVTDQTSTLDVVLLPLPRFTAEGTVTQAEDGVPVEGAKVRALDTPLAPVTTDAAGHYQLELPIGTYTLAADAGGCSTGSEGEVSSSVEHDLVTLDLTVVRKLDDFGYGCGPTDFDWVDATVETSLIGDDAVARLRLPFTFPFYGEDQSRVFVTTDGYLTFDFASFSEYFNAPIPDRFEPNNAIYPLWQDLVIDDDAVLETASAEVDGTAVFVLEWSNVVTWGGAQRGSFEVKLWEDGRIDVLWAADNPTALTGRSATIGIEGPDGQTGIQYGFRQPVAVPGTAVRFEELPTGTVSGTVTDLNDGEPIAGATVVAEPSGRTAVTDADGKYEMRLLEGSYDLTASAPLYVPATGLDLGVQVDTTTVFDAALAASTLVVDPDVIGHELSFAEVGTTTLTIANDGTAPLSFEIRERELGTTATSTASGRPGVKRSAPVSYTHAPTYPAGYQHTVTGGSIHSGPLEVIIDDPVGDSFGSTDITTVRGGSDGSEMSVAIDYASGTPMDRINGFVYFDTDQDPETGDPPEWFFGLPTQDIGVDYFAEFFEIHDPDPVVTIWEVSTFDLAAVVPVSIVGNTLAFDVPLTAFGPNEDGFIDVALDQGTVGPEDWAPDAGHGTIEAFRDAAWLVAEPASGEVPVGESVEVTVTVGGPNTQPGSYEALLVLLSNAPRSQGRTVPVSLDVAKPDAFGDVVGTTLDSRTFDPIAADVAIAATWEGQPVVLTSRADRDGAFRILAPEGSWPLTASREGYEDASLGVQIARGQTTDLGEVLLRPLSAQASLSHDELSVAVAADGKAQRRIQLRNTGPVPLGFDVLEFASTDEPVGDEPEPFAAPAKVSAPHPASAAHWRANRPSGARPMASQIQLDPGALPTILTDPEGDALGAVDVIALRGGSDFNDLGVALEYSASTDMDQVADLVFLDTDQDSTTGLPPEDLFGLPSQDVGVDYFADLWFIHDPEFPFVAIFDDNYEFVTDVPVEVFGNTVAFSVPLWAIGDGDATVDVAAADTAFDEDFFFDSDWIPDAGHGTAAPLSSDVPWLSITPATGVVPADGSRTLTLTVDAAGLPPGHYSATVLVVTDDPFVPTLWLPVTLSVSDVVIVPDPDVVTVRASTTQVDEPGEATLTLRRASTVGELTVRYRVGGTAQPGRDYTGLTGTDPRAVQDGTVTFGDGEASVRLPVTVLDDREHEGPETITLTLAPGNGYVAGGKGRVTLTILDDEAPLIEEIRRLAGDDRFLTAAAISQHAFGEGEAPAVVLARSDVFADALAGAPLAASLRAPLLLTRPDELHPVTADELVRVLPAGATVHLLGGEAALSQSVADAVSDLGFEVVRTAGETRYETAIEIAGRIGEPGTVLIATGEDFPDALAAGATAASIGGAVVLTPSDRPHPATDAYLAERPDVSRYAVGGPAARAYPSVTPVFGADRVATALAVAERFFDGPVAVGIARKDEFADALTGAAHIARWSGAMLLTGSEQLAPDVAAYLSANADPIVAAYLYGGEVALTKAVLDAVVALLA